MKTKTINAVITRVINEWIESIEDETVRELARKNVIVTGGAIASMLLREKVNDYDVYFRNRETAIAVAKYYVERFQPQKKTGIGFSIVVDQTKDDRVSIKVKSAGVASEKGTDKPYEYFESSAEGEATQYISDVMDTTIENAADIQEVYELTQEAVRKEDDEDGKDRYRPVFLSTNAITLSNKVQLVLRFYGEPHVLHENYDFVHCTNYWDSKTGKVTLRAEALEALLTKELVYIGSKYPVCSIIRLRKFIGRQWTINAGQILKIIMQINELDLTDIEVLKDQLTGVDSAYFCEVISKLKEKDPKKVNTAYLIEIIERIF